jgi:phosphohistidine phosphatase
MARRLILMRHAKSGWDDPMLADHDRPLAPRGVSAERGYLPDEALVSSALRTRETWDGVQAKLAPCPVAHLPALYHAGPDTMMQVLQGAAGNCVLMLGHNPGIAEFARLLVSRAPGHPRFGDYPTAATLIADFPTDTWRETRFGTARPVDFVVPRDLG